MSHDFEDIIYVLDNNIEIVEDIKNSDSVLINFLKEMTTEILENSSRNEIIECHMNPYTANERITMIIDKLKKIRSIES